MARFWLTGILDEEIAVEHLAADGGLGVEQRRGAAHLHALRDGADFELDVDARHLAGADHEAFADVSFEAGRLDRDGVSSRSEIRNLVYAFGGAQRRQRGGGLPD